MRPSFLGLIATGFLNLAAVILILVNLKAMSGAVLVQVILLLCISIGIHSQLHFNEELYYRFNPLAGHWAASDVAAQVSAPVKAQA